MPYAEIIVHLAVEVLGAREPVTCVIIEKQILQTFICIEKPLIENHNSEAGNKLAAIVILRQN